jgi:hypothetical protein
MKQQAVIMVPMLVEFENPGNDLQRTHHAQTLCDDFGTIIVGEHSFTPKLALVIPQDSLPEPPLVFDPPPMAA